MNTTLIKIDNLSFGYRKKTPLFSHFNLDIPAGQIIGLLGKNGTGKSTLLYLTCGLLRPKQGTITMQGTDVKNACRSHSLKPTWCPKSSACPMYRWNSSSS